MVKVKININYSSGDSSIFFVFKHCWLFRSSHRSVGYFASPAVIDTSRGIFHSEKYYKNCAFILNLQTQ